ncbi:MAG: hypothetical protein ACRCX2_20340 [Paraclostridium sp.]
MKKLLIYRTLLTEDKFAVTLFKSFFTHKNFDDHIDYIYADKDEHIVDIVRNNQYFIDNIHSYDKILFLGFGDINLNFVLPHLGLDLDNGLKKVEILYPRKDSNFEFNSVMKGLGKGTRHYLGIDGSTIVVFLYLINKYLGYNLHTEINIKKIDGIASKCLTILGGKLDMIRHGDVRNMPVVSWHDIDWIFSEYPSKGW